MLRRAAILVSRRPAAAPGGRPRHPSTAPPLFPSLRRAHAELRGTPPFPLLGTGSGGWARGYARMARRLPPGRPDGYSTSDGEEDLRSVDEDDLEPPAGAVDEEDGEDSEGSEMEGFMLQYGSGSDTDDGESNEEQGADERNR